MRGYGRIHIAARIPHPPDSKRTNKRPGATARHRTMAPGLYIPSLLGNTVPAFLFSLLMNSPYLLFRKFHRFVVFIPVLLSGIVIGMLAKQIFNENPGILNSILRGLGLEKAVRVWFDEKHAMTSVILIRIWKNMGLHMCVYLSAMQNISPEVLDAAEIDGANRHQRNLFIVTPMMADTIRVSFLLTVTDSLKLFEIIFATTKGGSFGSASSTMTYYTYRQAFEYFRYGDSCTSAVVSIIISVGIVMLCNYVLNKKVNVYE